MSSPDVAAEDEYSLERYSTILGVQVSSRGELRRSSRVQRQPATYAPPSPEWTTKSRRTSVSKASTVGSAKRLKVKQLSTPPPSPKDGSSSGLPAISNPSDAEWSSESPLKKVKLSAVVKRIKPSKSANAPDRSRTVENSLGVTNSVQSAVEQPSLNLRAVVSDDATPTSELNPITFRTANAMSIPRPGPELTRLVEKAQEDGRILKSYLAAAVRLVDGRFLVPQKCDHCVKANDFCDRGWPCGQCKYGSCGREESALERTMAYARAETIFSYIARQVPDRNPQVASRPRLASSAILSTSHVTSIDRPNPTGRPEVWAEGRQALCETLPYYRAYQSSAYTSDGLCHGLLLDKQCGIRDYMDDEVVITRMGGGRTRNADGEMEQSTHQSAESSILRSFLQNMKRKAPVVLIVGQGNPTCPSKIPHAYCVLDWFHITHIWCEKVNKKNTYQIRFEKIHLDVPSWWAPERAAPIFQTYRSSPSSQGLVRASCILCKQTHAQMYKQGWMCPNTECPAFWTINGLDPPLELRYHMGFLRERTAWDQNIKPPYRLKPRLISAKEETDPAFSVTRICWKGVVCPRCGRCISREEWEGWACPSLGCGFSYSIPHRVLSPRSLLDAHRTEYEGHAVPFDSCSYPVQESVRFTTNYRIHTYTIPRCGTITHFMANDAINKRYNGPDDMFKALQQADMGLKRFSMPNGQVSGPMLGQHFVMNFGMPYKYAVAVESKSFSEAPQPILGALHRLSWAGEQSITDGSFQKFNELLTIGYFERQHISYHDDGESTLGPTIATLSLGGQARMTVRMKKTHYHGLSKSGVYGTNNLAMPGCRFYEERLKLNQCSGQMDESEWRDKLVQYIAAVGSKLGNAPIALDMALHHGDMVVMHGAKIQKYYEHAVIPQGKLRFALTCRYVKPGDIPADQHWKGDYRDDPSYHYDGDDAKGDVHIGPDDQNAVTKTPAQQPSHLVQSEVQPVPKTADIPAISTTPLQADESHTSDSDTTPATPGHPLDAVAVDEPGLAIDRQPQDNATLGADGFLALLSSSQRHEASDGFESSTLLCSANQKESVLSTPTTTTATIAQPPTVPIEADI